MSILYITYNQLVDDIRENLWKVPRNTDLILSIPRSGNIVASIITKYLNIGSMTIQDFCLAIHAGADENELRRRSVKGEGMMRNTEHIKNILVIDDTVYSGKQLDKWREILSDKQFRGFNFTFLVAYKEGPGQADIWFKDISIEATTSTFHSALYEWTIWQRTDLMPYFAFDLDGVICFDPPADTNIEAYEAYLHNPVPFHLPAVPPIYKNLKTTIITYRLEKYRKETQDFLDRRDIYCDLYMVNASSRESRNESIKPWSFKAFHYKNTPYLKLYIESNDTEAQLIHTISGKPVLCVSTNKLYQ